MTDSKSRQGGSQRAARGWHLISSTGWLLANPCQQDGELGNHCHMRPVRSLPGGFMGKVSSWGGSSSPCLYYRPSGGPEQPECAPETPLETAVLGFC